jgi:hypothetical protein
MPLDGFNVPFGSTGLKHEKEKKQTFKLSLEYQQRLSHVK